MPKDRAIAPIDPPARIGVIVRLDHEPALTGHRQQPRARQRQDRIRSAHLPVRPGCPLATAGIEHVGAGGAEYDAVVTDNLPAVGADVDVFDRERVFVERSLAAIVRDFPGLKVVVPAFAADACTWYGVATKAWLAEIWMMQAPGLRRCACDSLSTLKLPSRSMSTTAASIRKLPFTA